MFNIIKIKAFCEKHVDIIKHIPMIHIGGTNGKGSTAKMLLNILSECYRTGLYTSPYDRFRFDNIQIGQTTITPKEIEHIKSVYQHEFQAFELSEFEVDTVIALMHFYKEKCDIAIIEVGLGGLDDATNVITPILSAITNVGLDHQDVLGKKICEIALKKAGIIKNKVPVVIGHDMHLDAYDVIYKQAKLCGAPLNQAKTPHLIKVLPNLVFTYNKQTYDLGPKASYQMHNAALALEIVEQLNQQNLIITKQMIKEGLAKPLLHKRFEIIHQDPLVILDGAHNNEGITALVQSLQDANLKNIKVIMGVLKDKPYQDMLLKLKTISDDITLTYFVHKRALEIKDIHMAGIKKEADMKKALASILEDQHKIYLITGSLYFLSQAEPVIKELLK